MFAFSSSSALNSCDKNARECSEFWAPRASINENYCLLLSDVLWFGKCVSLRSRWISTHTQSASWTKKSRYDLQRDCKPYSYFIVLCFAIWYSLLCHQVPEYVGSNVPMKRIACLSTEISSETLGSRVLELRPKNTNLCKEETQCAYKVTMRRFQESIVAVEMQKLLHISVLYQDFRSNHRCAGLSSHDDNLIFRLIYTLCCIIISYKLSSTWDTLQGRGKSRPVTYM
jgi:hypothetical protein